ncbi:glutaminyl-peptide cyclotransferase [Candidatus Palauibacter sp.]|uniref:glutaminyl-peptide cyclotransferase n=1 Tax=Candidatus Palauibacter sp. TaxID=3101350 RepID=UPI003C6F8636
MPIPHGRHSLLILSIWGLAGCASPMPSIEYEILGTFPHDPAAYTQGLIFHEGHLIESTGRYGESSVRRVDVPTGEVVARVAVDSALFGEGLARVGSELFQLTWKSGRAFVYDLESFDLLREYTYEGEGWGLCFDGESLWMSDGSSALERRDPQTFEVLATVEVLRDGSPQRRLNELECVEDRIYANVYQTDLIVRIDKQTGAVLGEIDLSSVPLSARRPGDIDAVLNGIAYVPETGVFLVTGKLWPKLLALRLDG